jgi:hypothetical protein
MIDKSINNLKYKNYILNKLDTNNLYINFLKYKYIIGIRLEGKGRLTKRLTASRSLFKSSYQGGLKNISSSHQNLSSQMLRGFVKSNIQYSNINSKTRNGSFGLKS